MSHPDTAEELLPLAPLTINDYVVQGETEWYSHSKTGDIIKCNPEMMEQRRRAKNKRLVEEEIENEKKKEAKELRKAELKKENIKKYGKGK